MKNIFRTLLLTGLFVGSTAAAQDEPLLIDTRIRDPFILSNPTDTTYYLYSTAAPDSLSRWGGFNVLRSRDLVHWQKAAPIYRAPDDFWGLRNFWAPECHLYEGHYYLFGTLRGAADSLIGTVIFKSDRPDGTFVEHSRGRVTPAGWNALDGTLYVDRKGRPWMVFCHEWTQLGNGSIEAMQLKKDLSGAAGRPRTLFHAGDAPWVRTISADGRVTDGPFLYRNRHGQLLMVWSSFSGNDIYTVGMARSTSGEITGPWEQNPRPLYDRNGGHSMLFRTFDGRLMMTLHQPNISPQERPRIYTVEETPDGWLRIAGDNGQ